MSPGALKLLQKSYLTTFWAYFPSQSPSSHYPSFPTTLSIILILNNHFPNPHFEFLVILLSISRLLPQLYSSDLTGLKQLCARFPTVQLSSQSEQTSPSHSPFELGTFQFIILNSTS